MISQRGIPQRLWRAIDERGVWGTIEKIASKIGDYWFDIRFGTDTCRWVPVSRLDARSPNLEHATEYQPTGQREFRSLMNVLDLPSAGTFVDFGSGKGRTLLIASGYGFSRVVGVEFSGQLCAVARSNVRAYQRKVRGGCPIEIVESDAAEYTVRDDENFFFLFNPFDAVVVAAVLRNIAESVRRRSRRVWLIYSNPLCRDLVDESSMFVEVGEYRYPRAEFVVYATDHPSCKGDRAVLEGRG